MKTQAFAALSIAFFLLSGCGADSSFQESTVATASGVPVLFLLGGRDSCKYVNESDELSPLGSGLYESFKILMDRMASDGLQKPEYFAACHYNGSEDMAFVSSWDQEVQYDRSEDEVRRAILKKRSEIQQSQAIIVGHSFGGWIAMSLVSELTQSKAMGQLYTLDPISKIECSFFSPDGCNSAPGDFQQTDRQKMTRNSTQWQNYYQEQSFFIHSSSIEEADRNFYVDLDHTDMDQDSEAWEAIYQGTISQL
jgi:hypothetical protein